MFLILLLDFDTDRYLIDTVVGLSFSAIIFGVVAYYTWKSVLGPIPRSWSRGEFPQMLKYSEASTMKAYICLGINMVIREKENSQSQTLFLNRYLKQKFPHQTDYTYNDIKAFRKLNINPLSVLKWCSLNFDERRKLQLLDFLADLAFYNQSVNNKEISLLVLTSKHLNIGRSEYNAIVGIRMEQHQRYHQEKRKQRRKRSFQPSTKKEKALRQLGLKGNPSPEEIKKRYRELAKKFHPDRFAMLGEDELKMANERFAAINHAYDTLTT